MFWELARRNLGAGGKEYRANEVHAPLSHLQHTEQPPRSRPCAILRGTASEDENSLVFHIFQEILRWQK